MQIAYHSRNASSDSEAPRKVAVKKSRFSYEPMVRAAGRATVIRTVERREKGFFYQSLGNWEVRS